MMNINKLSYWRFVILFALMLSLGKISAQVPLSLTEAMEIGIDNYEIIKSKRSLRNAANDLYKSSRMLYLPEMTVSTQQFYGTANTLHGAQYNFGEGISSMGAPNSSQNWDAAFSSLYLTNFNWNIFSFGATKNTVSLHKNKLQLAEAELKQEIFQHQIKIASAYLNLAAIREIIKVQRNNIERALVFVATVRSLTDSGIRPLVELSTSEAELAASKISLYRAQDKESMLLKELIMLLGTEYENITLDESILLKLPEDLISNQPLTNHPVLLVKDLSVYNSKLQSKIFASESLPKINLVGAITGRDSGFGYNYASDKSNLTKSYFDAVGIDRVNYLLGVNLSWNITSFAKNRYKSLAQRHITNSLNWDRELTKRDLEESIRQSDQKIEFTRSQYREVLHQTSAASTSYAQYQALYNNGLSNVDDVIQSLYNLSRAESEKAVIHINVWQAYLLKIAGNGNIEE